MSYLDYL